MDSKAHDSFRNRVILISQFYPKTITLYCITPFGLLFKKRSPASTSVSWLPSFKQVSENTAVSSFYRAKSFAVLPVRRSGLFVSSMSRFSTFPPFLCFLPEYLSSVWLQIFRTAFTMSYWLAWRLNVKEAFVWVNFSRYFSGWMNSDKMKRSFFPSSGCVDTAIWMHNMDAN